MASSIQLLRSTNAQERPFPGNLLEGQPAVNLNSTEPGLFFKAADGSLIKFGPAAITSDGSPPNSSPQGSAGNTVGELWLDKSTDPAVLKVYDGADWVDAGSGGGGGGAGSFVRWIYTAVGGETSLSGSSGGVLLDYTPGLEEVFVNGVLITRGTDYSATNGTSITNLTPLTAGDVVTVTSMNPLEVVQLPGQVTLLRWTILAAAGQTVLSGVDSSSQQLAYTPGFEEVYVNGAFLRRGPDYTATNGTSITLASPLALDDEVTILAWSPFNVGQIDGTTLTDDSITDVKINSAAAVQSSKLSFLRAGQGTVARTVQSKLQDIVSVVDFGADPTGSIDSAPFINAAASSVPNGTTLYFPSGTYKIESTLSNFAKRIQFVGESQFATIIKNDSSSAAISLEVSYYPQVRNLTIRGNSLSGPGIYISSPHVVVEDCFIQSCGSHGIEVKEDNWVLTFNRVTCLQNDGDGIHVVGKNNGSINAVNILACILWLNKGNGVALSGTQMNVRDCTIEGNDGAGVFIDTSDLNASVITINDNYFEANKGAHVFFGLDPIGGGQAGYVTIANNYMVQISSVNPGIVAVIQASTTQPYSGLSNIEISGSNRYETNLKRVDLNNAVGLGGETNKSIIQAWGIADTANPAGLFQNCGFAIVDSNIKTIGLPGHTYCSGITYSSVDRSDNIISGVAGAGVTGYFTLPLQNGNIIRRAAVRVETDSGNWGVIASFVARNPLTEAEIVLDSQTILAQNSTQTISTIDFSDPSEAGPLAMTINTGRNYFLKLTFTSSGGGTIFRIAAPTITYFSN